MIDLLNFSVHLTTTVLAFGAGFFALKIRATFKGGRLWRPWQVIAPSAILYGFAGVTEILADITENSVLNLLESILELVFVLTLAYGLYIFYNAWSPKEPKK